VKILPALEVGICLMLLAGCASAPPAALNDLQGQQAKTSEVIGEATVIAGSLVSDLADLDIPQPIIDKAKALEEKTQAIKESHDTEQKITVKAAGDYARVVASLAEEKKKSSKWFWVSVSLAIALAALIAIMVIVARLRRI